MTYKGNDEYSKYLICVEPIPLREEINLKFTVIKLLKKYWNVISRNIRRFLFKQRKKENEK